MKTRTKPKVRRVTGLRCAPSLYNWIRHDTKGRKAQANPTCSHCGDFGLWTESRFITPSGAHLTAMRCASCGKLSYFDTPKELRYGERRMTGPAEEPPPKVRPRRRR